MITPNTKTEPAVGYVTVLDGTLVLSDTVNVPQVIRSLRADVGGVIKVTCLNGVVARLNFAGGETRSGMFIRIWATGTTATGIEGAL